MSYIFVFLLLIVTHVFADSFISLEELLTQAQRWKFDVGVSYNQVNEQGLNVEFDAVEIFPGLNAPVSIPNTELIHQDVIIGRMGIKYGVSAWTEFSATIDYQWKWVATDLGTRRKKISEATVNETWIGITQRLMKEDRFPAVYGVFEASPIEYVVLDVDEVAHDRWRSFQLGLRAYKSIDPVIISLTVLGRKNRPKTQHNIKEGDQITVSPAVYFTINDEITLNWGMSGQYIATSYRNGRLSSLSRRMVSFNMGIGYMIEYDWTMSVTSTMSDNNVGVSIQSEYQF